MRAREAIESSRLKGHGHEGPLKTRSRPAASAPEARAPGGGARRARGLKPRMAIQANEFKARMATVSALPPCWTRRPVWVCVCV